MSEQDYERGERAAYARVVRVALTELGYQDAASDLELQVRRLVVEREATVAALRAICEEHGDNKWSPTLHLADVIEKHLRRHLDARIEALNDQIKDLGDRLSDAADAADAREVERS